MIGRCLSPRMPVLRASCQGYLSYEILGDGDRRRIVVHGGEDALGSRVGSGVTFDGWADMKCGGSS